MSLPHPHMLNSGQPDVKVVFFYLQGDSALVVNVVDLMSCALYLRAPLFWIAEGIFKGTLGQKCILLIKQENHCFLFI